MSPSVDDLHRAMGIYTAWIDAQRKDVAHIVAQEAKKGRLNSLTP